jgi:hypothetical protein
MNRWMAPEHSLIQVPITACRPEPARGVPAHQQTVRSRRRTLGE